MKTVRRPTALADFASAMLNIDSSAEEDVVPTAVAGQQDRVEIADSQADGSIPTMVKFPSPEEEANQDQVAAPFPTLDYDEQVVSAAGSPLCDCNGEDDSQHDRQVSDDAAAITDGVANPMTIIDGGSPQDGPAHGASEAQARRGHYDALQVVYDSDVEPYTLSGDVIRMRVRAVNCWGYELSILRAGLKCKNCDAGFEARDAMHVDGDEC